MAGLVGRTPKEAFVFFRDHLSQLLNRTVTDAPLGLVQGTEPNSAYLSFRRGDNSIAAPLRSSGLFLFVGQSLIVKPKTAGRFTEWRLKTVEYRYWIQGDSSFHTNAWFFRFEYKSPKLRAGMHPRNHLHLPCLIPCVGSNLNLADIHIPTGWVTVEEMIRFLIQELGVKSRARKWHELLVESERTFRLWIRDD